MLIIMGDVDNFTPAEQPRIVANSGDPMTDANIRRFEAAALNDPSEMQHMLSTIQPDEIGALSLGEKPEIGATYLSSPKSLLIGLLKNRWDIHIEYDPDTEKSIEADESYLALRAIMHNLRSVKRKVGAKTVNTENPAAPAARDAVRLKRLSLYLSRLEAWQRAADNTQTSIA